MNKSMKLAKPCPHCGCLLDEIVADSHVYTHFHPVGDCFNSGFWFTDEQIDQWNKRYNDWMPIETAVKCQPGRLIKILVTVLPFAGKNQPVNLVSYTSEGFMRHRWKRLEYQPTHWKHAL